MKLLDRINSEYSKLHLDYEQAFWLSYMGDHSYDDAMEKARIKRDEFRSSIELREEVKVALKTSTGKNKDRLKIWDRFFGLYQIPKEAEGVKTKISRLENEIMKIRTTRKEGYVDPKSNEFVLASENKMRTLMRTADDEGVRKACFLSLEKLPYDTLDKYVELIKLRNDFAKILGFADFYEYKAKIDENMSKKELFSIFEKIYDKTKYAFKNVRKLEKEKPGLRKPWNFAFMMAGSFIKEEDPYFQFQNVLDYWGRSMSALGVDLNGGTVQFDLLDRQGKYNNGFCQYPDLVRNVEGKWYVGSANISSTAIPNQLGSGVQGIDTVFHEGGHAADRLCSTQPDCCLNHEYPPNTVSWAETQSMFMDTISSSIEWRMRYAKDQNGSSYPFDLYERKVRALYPLRPLDLMGIMHVVFFEKEVYECKNLSAQKVIAIAKKIYKKYFDRSEDSISVLNVPHTYSWESSAYYHGYGLAELGVSQWRQYFFKKYGYIVDNPKVGKEMKKVWSYGSLYPAKKLVKLATGKTLSPKAYIDDVTKPLEKIIVDAKSRVARLNKVPEYKKPVDLKGKLVVLHGKDVIADNSISFEDMEEKYRKWLKSR
jgi:oligoendopeptidase F